MKGRSTDMAHSRRVGKNWVITGLWMEKKGEIIHPKKRDQRLSRGDTAEALTRRLSTGLVTLNLSMVLTTMAGVVRKKRSRKRRMLRRTQRSHQRDPHTERFSLVTKRGEDNEPQFTLICRDGQDG